ncbi:hypothetical protein VMCG_03404 [Cytospora schulzeri]|uniref:AMP-dependent synthetase/ligase domain-containing protein n=1 Tax=Cytospora schulzeri TaxID=448051 RepID=A0A423WWV6_9PEZI|nr:hypothetical protein VMCG_03404 [Valsa malicola]
MAREYPPHAVGNRLLVETALDLADSDPGRLYATIPRTNNLAADGFRDVTFWDVGRMTTWLAGWIEEAWGKSTDHETIAYLGVPDLRPSLIFFAAVMNGYKYFPPSPRNAATVNTGLLEQTKCSKIICAAEAKPLADQLCKLTGASALQVPPLDDLLAAEPREYEYSRKAFEDAKNVPILILHSSGSTGLPKPIVMTNGTFAALDNEKTLPGVEGRTRRDYSIWDFEGGGKFFTPMPFFHLSGFLSLVFNPVFTEASTPVIAPPGAAPNGALLKEVLKQQEVRAMYIPPFMAEQLLSEPNGFDYFRGLDFVCYTGSPFSPSAGQQLVQVTNLVPLYVSTEAFQVPQLVPLLSKEDWDFMEWNPPLQARDATRRRGRALRTGALRRRIADDDDDREALGPQPQLPRRVGMADARPLRAHPSRPNLWRYYGRRDDIVVLWDGYKFNPIQPELVIGACKLLSGVLVVGKGRRGPALVLERKADRDDGGDDDEALIEEVWPLVEQMNAQSAQNYRIARSRILVVLPGTLVRAGKGTVIRKLSEQKLQTQIDDLYAEGTNPTAVALRDSGLIAKPDHIGRYMRPDGQQENLSSILLTMLKLIDSSKSHNHLNRLAGPTQLLALALSRALVRRSVICHPLFLD